MAGDPTPIRYFELKIGLKSTLDLYAGDSATQASAGQYRTRNNVSRQKYAAIMNAVATAILAQDETVSLLVSKQKWIEGVPVAAAASVAAKPEKRSAAKPAKKKK